jgi:hypothetical protein
LTESPAQTALTPPPRPASVPSQVSPNITDLIWEDEPHESQAWWLTRTRCGDLQVFIVSDQLTTSLLCLSRSGARPNAYDVLAVIPELLYPNRLAAVVAAKHGVAIKMSNPQAEIGRPISAWRFTRGLKMALNQAPLAATAFLLGALLGLAVALFAISTSMIGWPMLAVGIIIGAASGPLLKLLVDRRFKSLLGPWGRFWVATLSAALGAFAAAGGLLTLFWT